MTAGPASPASTVLVARDAADGVEVYVQRRPESMTFVGGLWVFPGGRVDDADADAAIDRRWTGPPPTWWAQVMGLAVDRARGHVVAAYRETFEESGILLAAGRAGAGAVARARRALLDDEARFVDVADELDVGLDTTVLRYWDWWVTPGSEPRRYDTRFFVARLPTEAVVTPHDGEVVDEHWADRGGEPELSMIAPTRHTLRAALAHRSVDALLAAADERTIAAVQPTIEDGDVVLPSGARYPLPGRANEPRRERPRDRSDRRTPMSDLSFTLPDQHEQPVSSDDFTGRRLVVFFYPKAMTPGCTGEACDFRDRYELFTDAGYALVGISPDEPADNATFAARYDLPFRLLSDPDHEVAARFGAWGTKRNYGREYEGLIRSTFVLDDAGELEHAWRNVRAKGHVARVARDLGLAES